MNLLGREHVPSNPIDDGLKQPHRLANPIGQCRAIELDPVPRVDLALPVERQVIAKLRHQQVCERRRCRTTARCRHRRRRSLGDRVAGLAGILGPNVPNDLEAAWHVVQHFRHILTELRHAGAAVRADACTVGVRLMHDLLARQMIRQWLRFGFARIGSGRSSAMAAAILQPRRSAVLRVAIRAARSGG